MALKIDEISSLIKSKVEHYHEKISVDDIGKIISVGDGIVLAEGLNGAMAMELVLFEDGTYGMVMNLEEDVVGIVILGSDEHIKEGQDVKRTGRIIEVPVGDVMLGRVVNALGQEIDGGKAIETKDFMPIEKVAPGVMTRLSVKEPLMTGLKVIDSMIPIGKGQRELIIGDRQTGKTAIAIDTIINQRGKNVKCIYVAIGQKASTVALIVEKLKEFKAMDYTCVVMASASDSAPMQYIAPYAGCAIGEYWLNKGEDVLIVYDDLSKHAVAYRTVSLLLRRPPGREAYPGDVFYLHSRLLERACKLNKDNGGGSLTALPIIETQAGDISAYIPTNVISITDGQIFLQSELFNSGARPAVDSGLSVSRVGSSAQTKCVKKVSSSLKLELAQYQELLGFTQFGSDLDPVTKKTIDHGARLMELLKQPQYQPLTNEAITISLFAAKHHFLDEVKLEDIKVYESELHKYMQDNHQVIIDTLKASGDIDDDTSKKLMMALAAFKELFILKHGALDGR
ncbi:MAG: F0F1 ATP synthase subunit alpha [Erysipelotrichaceae bacterium]|nr:F0F1 ATP synthase subunit alpha [Erysipelotrichaceae bacterium]